MRGPSGRELRIALASWAAVFALQSWYYAAGGTAGADAFPPAITHPVLAREPAAVALMWLAGMAKLGIGMLGFAITSSTAARPHRRALRALGWLAAAAMADYEGLASLIQHAAMLAGLLPVPSGLGRTSAIWHPCLFDPDRLLGGSLLAALVGTTAAVANTNRRTRRLSASQMSGALQGLNCQDCHSRCLPGVSW